MDNFQDDSKDQKHMKMLPIAIASNESYVICPKRDCDTAFEISPDLYHEVAECSDCKTIFVIKPPGTKAN